jgi:hypothetical protein
MMIYGNEVADKKHQRLPFFSMKRYWSQWFYKHVEEVYPKIKEEILSLEDYIFRHDRGIFWLAESKMNPTRLNRFLFGWLFNMQMHHRLGRLKKDKKNESRRFLADVGPTIDKIIDYIEEVDDKLDIYPLWLLPVKIIQENQKILSPDRMYKDGDFMIDLGIYGVPKKQPFKFTEMNIYFEDLVHEMGGIKGFETVCYYEEKKFWQYFDKKSYDILREKYHAEGVFLNIYDKISVIT